MKSKRLNKRNQKELPRKERLKSLSEGLQNPKERLKQN
jgi:hypothetical protein